VGGNQGLVTHNDESRDGRFSANPGLDLTSASQVTGASTYSGKPAKGQRKPEPRTVLKEREVGYLIGNPMVAIDRDERKAVVWIANRPRGFLTNSEREFLNPLSAGVERYASKLLASIRAEGEREAARQERYREAKRREREEGL
jgi:hypothetical protein